TDVLASTHVGQRRSVSFKPLNVNAYVAVGVYWRRPRSASTEPTTMGWNMGWPVVGRGKRCHASSIGSPPFAVTIIIRRPRASVLPMVAVSTCASLRRHEELDPSLHARWQDARHGAWACRIHHTSAGPGACRGCPPVAVGGARPNQGAGH